MGIGVEFTKSVRFGIAFLPKYLSSRSGNASGKRKPPFADVHQLAWHRRSAIDLDRGPESLYPGSENTSCNRE